MHGFMCQNEKKDKIKFYRSAFQTNCHGKRHLLEEIMKFNTKENIKSEFLISEIDTY